eukprot:TRINITY_DN994_c0_g1_i1.p1 TRINITY_DN994_c0_g1~~TRINITY_DN994_c0_g1_i1.p1  ORF type:complete len:363 (+),score=107.40 TRINITY_DN994_c0_g1_i1:48-1136(+)
MMRAKHGGVLAMMLMMVMIVPSYGWWDTGHMLTAQVARLYLQQQNVSKAVFEALDNAISAFETYDSSANTFITAACWMDDLKVRGMSQFSEWHFVNLPYCDFPNNTLSCPSDETPADVIAAEDGQDVIWAIQKGLYTLTSKSTSGFERGFALRNLLHFIGDIHQPLHCSERYSPETPNGDLGGNLFIINTTFTNNLHGFWDSGAGWFNNSISRPLNQDEINYLVDTAQYIMNQTVLTPGISDSTNVTLWAMESLNYAINYAYPNITFGSAPSADYTERAKEICIQQIGTGGYRLALFLSKIYGCNSDLNNCPTSSPTVITQNNDRLAMILGITLGSVLLVSLIVNLGLVMRLHRRNNYSQVE